ncbi:single-stranded DNA-binding protein (plasmid) [Aneurinibacillus sp. Ricciae_BoGa-3]|uniref:single-stranded DNA-binding protein n=1 Tax=Aneurinibacillus sp. Ricciae_BoGa-3 TaxID=3022697 RepID=UPI002341D16B|nr:single-stranded DNA-binding protein [Aneurinibacillus sp. Ricciae_BoGa-3]WCK57665.1 single-stranded DNA-binding protein [Aneurinibacillus sp. Ricciae_BoGa-3]
MNQVKLVGISTGELTVNHSFRGKENREIVVLETEVEYVSPNHITNRIKLLVYKESEFARKLVKKGQFFEIFGTIRSFNKDSFGKRICEIYVQPTYMREIFPTSQYKNEIQLSGIICGNINYKIRRKGKKVAETKLKVRREKGIRKFDYIPIVAFGENANVLNRFEDGETIDITGRIHSRNFLFNYVENGIGREINRTAYEVGVHDIVVHQDMQHKEQIVY